MAPFSSILYATIKARKTGYYRKVGNSDNRVNCLKHRLQNSKVDTFEIKYPSLPQFSGKLWVKVWTGLELNLGYRFLQKFGRTMLNLLACKGNATMAF